MKATKLIINWEVQNLASENESAWVCYIWYDYADNEYEVFKWELKEDALIFIEDTTSITDSITIGGNEIQVIWYNNVDGWWIDWWTN